MDSASRGWFQWILQTEVGFNGYCNHMLAAMDTESRVWLQRILQAEVNFNGYCKQRLVAKNAKLTLSPATVEYLNTLLPKHF